MKQLRTLALVSPAIRVTLEQDEASCDAAAVVWLRRVLAEAAQAKKRKAGVSSQDAA